MRHLTRRRIALRKATPAPRLDALTFRDVPAPFLAFDRIVGNAVLTCVLDQGYTASGGHPDGSVDRMESVNLRSDGEPGARASLRPDRAATVDMRWRTRVAGAIARL